MSNWQEKELLDFYHTNFEFTTEQMKEYLEPLRLEPGDIFIDFGCGNGALLDYVAPLVARAVGVDISDLQLSSAAATLNRHKNIQLIKGNFLEGGRSGNRFTKGSARKTLHHLTDDEKCLFFERQRNSFTKDALFIIEDAIFTFDIQEFQENEAMVLQEARNYYGSRWEQIQEGFKTMLSEEYPTGFATWQKALQCGGFEVIGRQQKTCFYGTIWARRSL